MEEVFKNLGVIAVFLVFLVSLQKWFDASKDKKITLELLKGAKTEDAKASTRQMLEEEKDAVSRWRIVAVVTGGLLALAFNAGL